jgi:hypothetical protein
MKNKKLPPRIQKRNKEIYLINDGDSIHYTRNILSIYVQNKDNNIEKFDELWKNLLVREYLIEDIPIESPYYYMYSASKYYPIMQNTKLVERIKNIRVLTPKKYILRPKKRVKLELYKNDLWNYFNGNSKIIKHNSDRYSNKNEKFETINDISSSLGFDNVAICGSIIPMMHTVNIEDFKDEYQDSDIDICVYAYSENHKMYERRMKQFGFKYQRPRSDRFIVTQNGYKFDIFFLNKPIAQSISNFHISCVTGMFSRGYGFYVLPSFIRMISRGGIVELNPRIRYLTLKKKQSIYKYIRRGFSFELSTQHIQEMIEYMKFIGYSPSNYIISINK